MPDPARIQQSKNKYLQEKVTTFTIRVPKDERDRIISFAKSQGKSLNSFVVDLIHREMSQSPTPHNSNDQ